MGITAADWQDSAYGSHKALPLHIKCHTHSPLDVPPHHDGLGGVFLGLRQALWEEPLAMCPPNSNTPIVVR